MKHLNLTLLLTFCVITTLIYSVNYFFTSAIPLNGYRADRCVSGANKFLSAGFEPLLKDMHGKNFYRDKAPDFLSFNKLMCSIRNENLHNEPHDISAPQTVSLPDVAPIPDEFPQYVPQLYEHLVKQEINTRNQPLRHTGSTPPVMQVADYLDPFCM